MYDSVRWLILGIFFVALVAAWFWARHQEAQRKALGKEINASFRILQKRWLDKGTGVCLVEAEERTFLLAYTVGGGVSWQEVEPKVEASPENRLKAKFEFPGV